MGQCQLDIGNEMVGVVMEDMTLTVCRMMKWCDVKGLGGESFLSNSTPTCKPNSTSVGLSRS